MKIKFYSFITMMLIGSFAFGQTAISNCGDFTAGSAEAWPEILTAALNTDGASSQEAQSFSMNVTSLPDGGANFRVFKTTANGGNFFGNPQALVLGENGITVAAVGFDRTVKFQFSTGDVEFDFLSVNSNESACTATSAEPSTAVSDCDAFDDGPNTTWTDVLTAALDTDGASSQEAQSFTMNVTSLPDGGANYRVVKTVANGNWNNGPATALNLGTNTKTVPGVAFDRTVKFQFSSGDVEFSTLTLNGEDVSCEAAAVETLTVTTTACSSASSVAMTGPWWG
ncbi:MAG: hypothetical protein CL850_05185, partial [Crocinitomicaceae bacterium]|nr:hypothetical protein [Crocinitomicaceae bacterium]